jgi:hypothetical protein
MTTYNDIRWDSLGAAGQAARNFAGFGRDSALITTESLQTLLRDYEVATQAFEAASRALDEHPIGSSTNTFCELVEAEERAHDAVVLARTRVFVRRCELQTVPEAHKGPSEISPARL